ncbi:Anti-sigma regulatory factor [Candidatus Sulfobium mesophilum]|uniref:Anti-sigma regulatory factor n=1 Tax=Candidatus Sulfobium mesophilum TaxID=2016548 RepID=A0A2U3QGK2_9BACT|nr:Anti-sigma regulatory factor [Candidatus Sulfobium mesophilum]
MKVLADTTVPARLESLEGLVKSATGSALQWGLAGEGLFAVELATEEAVVNVFKYAYPHGEGKVRLRCVGEGDRFVIEVTDWGIPFDATAQPDPDVTGPLEKRSVGGLGIHLMRNMTDEISYKREDGQNILSLFIRKDGT